MTCWKVSHRRSHVASEPDFVQILNHDGTCIIDLTPMAWDDLGASLDLANGIVSDHNAVSQLSSPTRDLLLSNPQAVELAIKAVQAVAESETILHKSGPNIVREAIEAFEEIAKKLKEDENAV